MTSATLDAQCGDTKDAQNPTGVCPLKLDKIQLIPVRYGLVETLAAEGEISVPFETKSKPIGIRLLRDGWLYVLVQHEGEWILHEYLVKDGQITSLLWQDSEVAQDIRTSSAGDANLVFNKSDELFVCYSEVQWTARKCSQVIQSELDRERFLQRVSLSDADPVNGKENLLASGQAASLIAECAETSTSDQQASGLSYSRYEWEHKALYQSTDFSVMNAKVLPKYQHDHFYLVLNDDIGILRDLASYQALVATSLETWTSDEEQYQKFVEGCYIESQIAITPDKIDQLALAVGDPTFANSLDDDQKQAVVEWLKFQEEPGSDHARSNAYKKIQLKDALGTELWGKYEELIGEIEDHYQRQMRGISGFKFWDSNAGTPGILDLIHEDEMMAFLKEERKKLDHWQSLLVTISQDRTALFDRFYPAAWYFDATNVDSLQNLLAAEYSCVQDLCWSDESTALVADKLDEMPWISYRGIYSLPAEDYTKVTEEIAKRIAHIRSSITSGKSLEEINDVGSKINGLLDEQIDGGDWGPKLAALDENLKAFDALIDASFAPANTIDLAKNASALLDKANSTMQFDPIDIFRDLKGSAWLELIKAYRIEGLSVVVASATELAAFDNLKTQAEGLRAENRRLKNQIRQEIANLRKAGRSINHALSVDTWRAELKNNQSQLLTVETKLAEAISPIGEGPAKVGYSIKGLSAEMRADIKQMTLDLQTVKNNPNLFDKWRAPVKFGKWDLLSLLLVGISISNAYKALDKSNLTFRSELAGAVSSILGFIQGVRATTDIAAIKLVSSKSSTLVYGIKLGKWTTFLGGGAYVFGAISSGLKAHEAFHAWRKGNTKALITLAGEGGMFLVNGWGLGNSMHVGFTVYNAKKVGNAAIAAAWAGNGARLVSMTIRLTLVGIAISAVQVVATVWYNRANLSKYLAWFESSQWGKEKAVRTLGESNLQLARISAKPGAEIKQFGQGRALFLTFPGLTSETLDKAGVNLSAYWKTNLRNNDWKSWTHELAQQWVCLSAPEEPLLIALPLFGPEINAEHGIAIELHYFPTPDATERDILRFQAESFTRVGPLSEVAQFKARNVSAYDLTQLTTQHITWKIT